jgi:hypothetical protein
MSKEWLLVSRAPQTVLTTCDMYQWVRSGCWVVVPPRQYWQLATCIKSVACFSLNIMHSFISLRGWLVHLIRTSQLCNISKFTGFRRWLYAKNLRTNIKCTLWAYDSKISKLIKKYRPNVIYSLKWLVPAVGFVLKPCKTWYPSFRNYEVF